MPDRRPILLPADRYLAAMLWPEDDPLVAAAKYERFKNEIESQVRIDPSQPQAGAALGIIALVSGIISVGLTVVASFFKPKAPEPGTGGVTATDQQGANIVANNRVAPSIGFDAVQQPSALGSTIPVIWARRQTLGAQASPPRPAGTYGGVRVNTGLIWSQIWTYKGAQIVRAIFLIGEGGMGTPDPNGYAIGDNSLASYQIENTVARELASRATIYVSTDGGAITSADRVLGRAANQDVANNENYGGPTVFSVRDRDEEYVQNFCYATKPSTSTTFGLYSHIPNGMGFRVNPRIRPTIRVTTKPKNDGENFEVDCDDDPQALAELWKQRYQYPLRGAIVWTSTGNDYVYPGDRIRYKLDNTTDAETKFVFDESNTDNTTDESDGESTCSDVANGVSARQRSADEALIIGELYKIGSCLAVLLERVPDDRVFISDGDNQPIGDGQSMEYVFRVIRQGRVGIATASKYLDPTWSGTTIKPPQWNKSTSLNNLGIPDEQYTCSEFPQIFRCAMATFRLGRSARIFEVGFRSTVGIRISGLCNLRDCQSLSRINQNAGLKYQGRTFDKNDKIGVTNYQSGTIQRSETRISFFRILFREDGGAWEVLEGIWGFKGSSDQAILNTMRFEMLTERAWEVWFEPISSYELRSGENIDGPICIIDGKSGQQRRTSVNDGIIVEWYGETRSRDRRNFNLPNLDPKEDIGIPKADSNSFLDDWAMVAESFFYNEIQTTIENGPEHEIVYVNTFSVNAAVPTYDRIATLGLTIYGSTEFRQLSQFSAYISDGKFTRKTLEQDESGSTNLFPDILRAYLTNKRYGRGEVVGDALVDLESFREAAAWCQVRRYFYDAADATRVNLLQWAADTASYHLLELNQRGGKWALSPAIIFPEDGPVPVRALFTAGNIVEGTFKLQYLPDTERQRVRMSVKWREERQRADLTSAGFFPVEREVFVQEAIGSDTDPIEPLDLSSFCTNAEHAIDVACYFIRMRRLITHTISFSTTPDGLTAGLAAGNYIKVAMDLSYFDQFSHGVILDDGSILSTRNDLLPPGEHQVSAWDGVSDFIYDTTITIDENGKADQTGIVFAKKTTTSEVRTYKIEKISISEDGLIDIEAVHHPCDSEGISEIGKNWTTYQTDANWIIEGNEVEADYCTCPVVQGIPVPGNVLSVGNVICNSGTASTISVRWFRDYLAIPGAVNSTYTFTSQDSGRVIFAEITYVTTRGEIQTCRTFAAESDAFASAVVLLLHMNGQHNTVSFVDNSPYAHNPFVGIVNLFQGGSLMGCRIIRWNSRFGGSCATYYSSSFGGPYLTPTFTHPTAFQITASEDFTMECWIFMGAGNGNIFNCFGFNVTLSSNSIRVSSGSWFIQTSQIPFFTWTHVAVVRNNGVVNVYVDGSSRASGLAAFASGTTTCTVGRADFSLQDEVRLTKGIARYTGSFTPPDAPFLPPAEETYPDEAVVFLMHCNGVNGSLELFNDTVYAADTITGTKAGHTFVSNAQSKFGGTSLYFSGDFTQGSTVSTFFLPNATTQDYTIDLWIWPISKSGALFDKYGSCFWSGSVLVYQFNADGALRTLSFENTLGGKTIPLNQWSHIAVTRSGLVTRCFLNGEIISSYTAVAKYGLFDGNTSRFQIGGRAFNTALWSGYLDEFRVMFNRADWTSNFTPPTQPYPNPTS